jgi:antirestriction protein ArdC
VTLGELGIELPVSEACWAATSLIVEQLDRASAWSGGNFGRKQRGDAGYAVEELVAELGAAFLSADLCLTPEPRNDQAAYLASWMLVLMDDNRAIFRAAAHAERAVGHLHSLQPKQDG